MVNAPVLKTGLPKGNVGSSPTPTAIFFIKRGVRMGWVFDERFKVYSNDFGDLYFVIRIKNGKICLYELATFDPEIIFDSIEDALGFDVESYAEELRKKQKKYEFECMKARYNQKPSKVKRYYIYEIDSGLFLGKNNQRQFFLCEEPLQTFTMSQASALKAEYNGLYLFDWLLIEA